MPSPERSIIGRNVFNGVDVRDGGTINLNFAASSSSGSAKPFNMTPFPPDPGFVERPALSKRIEKIVAENGRGVALVGLGGVGQVIYL